VESDMLAFDYEPIQGQRLRKVFGRAPLTFDDGSVGFDEVRFVLDECSLLFSVKIDTDEIDCRKMTEQNVLSGNAGSWVSIDALSDHLGSEIGWLWIGRNWMGYSDMMTLSFSGIEPNISLLGVASKLILYRLHKATG
jgi:hypothetical protein